MLLLALQILLKKNGKFPNIHVSGNPAMRKQGIRCVQAQDREAQRSKKLSVNESSRKKK